VRALLTWMEWWSRWCARQREQSAPFMQSRQYMLHSLLCASAWILHWTKKLVDSSGFSHGGHRWFSASSSSHSPPPCKRGPCTHIQSKSIATEINQEPRNRATQEQEESINYHGASALESERRRVIYCHLVAAEPRRMRASGRERGEEKPSQGKESAGAAGGCECQVFVDGGKRRKVLEHRQLVNYS